MGRKEGQVEAYERACVEALRKSGARVTKPRLAVIRCLARSDNPLSARELFEAIEQQDTQDSADQVSVYRILDALAGLGMVHQVFPSGGYLPCLHHACGAQLHVLIRCSKCEQIQELDVPQETLAPVIWYLKDNVGFEADTHVFQMNGLCKSCDKSS